MKNKVLFLIALILFSAGIIFKLAIIPLAGTLIAIGLILLIIWITIYYGNKIKLDFSDYMTMLLSIALIALIFKFIQSRVYAEILIVSLVIGLISFFTTVIIKKIRKN
jgi:hypothetical protein